MGGPVDRLRGAKAHDRRGAQYAVVTGATDHGHDRPDPVPLLAHQAPARVGEDHLCGGVRAVAELGLEPVQVEAVGPAVLGQARNQCQRQAVFGLGKDEEGVGLDRRDEPLAAADQDLPLVAATKRLGDRARAVDIGASAALGERHADQRTLLLRSRQLAGVVHAR